MCASVVNNEKQIVNKSMLEKRIGARDALHWSLTTHIYINLPPTIPLPSNFYLKAWRIGNMTQPALTSEFRIKARSFSSLTAL